MNWNWGSRTDLEIELDINGSKRSQNVSHDSRHRGKNESETTYPSIPIGETSWPFSLNAAQALLLLRVGVAKTLGYDAVNR